MDNHLRPWQGSVLGVLSYIGLGYSVIAGGSLLFGFTLLSRIFGGAGEGYLQSASNSGALDPSSSAIASGAIGGLQGLFGAFGTFFAIILFLLAFLTYKMGRAYFSGGKKWQIILTIILGALAVYGGFTGSAWVQLGLGAVMVVLAAMIYQNPFYNKVE